MSDNELLEKFWIEHGGKPHIPADLSFYESSWDMLMPLVEMICRFVYETHDVTYGTESFKEEERAYLRTFGLMYEGKFQVRFNRQQFFTNESLIKATYDASLHFIKWYRNEKE